MQRILIADSSRTLAESMEKQLNKNFIVKICCDGRRVLRMVMDFEPDIIVLDTMLPGCDGISILHSIRSAGGTENVVVLSANLSLTVQKMLANLGVVYAFSKPCNIQNVVCFVRQLALGDAGLTQWNPETEIDNILLRLGFRYGRGGYECTYEAIRLRYIGEVGYITKCLYTEVRKNCGKKNNDVVEKAIRDAIRHGWDNGDPLIWELYFPQAGKRECPSNDVFISRIARALQNREKLKKPCKLEIAKEKQA